MLRSRFTWLLSRLLFLSIACLMCCKPAGSESPRTLSVSGVLTGGTGQPKPNGPYTLTFRLFDALTGGTPLWTEPNRTITVSGGKGAFTTLLGSASPLSLPFDRPYYLEVQASGDPAMAPRLPLSAVPYSLSSGSGALSLPFAGTVSLAAPGTALKVTNSGSGLGIVSEAPANIGVNGVSDTWVGVWGQSRTSAGVQGVSDVWVGVAGKSTSGAGVYGESDSWVGVWGQSNKSTGMHGQSETWIGVYGQSKQSTGVHGQSDVWIGVFGMSGSGTGVWGESTSGPGVHGQSKGGPGVFGEGLRTTGSPGGPGVHGVSHYFEHAGVLGVNDFRGGGVGVVGKGIGDFTIGVRGSSGSGALGELGTYDSNGRGIGVRAEAPVSGGTGLYAVANPGSVAGLFSGDVAVNGRLDVYGVKNFRIDHPLDPANRTLTHSCAEGPEALNIYKGRVTTDANGEAVVRLPDYFEALNRDFEYQFTCIGQFAQAIVAEEIHDNRFTIRTDKPNVTVSWQVTGVRNDVWMRMHARPAEELKPDNERGRYLDPESHGQPREKAVSRMERASSPVP